MINLPGLLICPAKIYPAQNLHRNIIFAVDVTVDAVIVPGNAVNGTGMFG